MDEFSPVMRVVVARTQHPDAAGVVGKPDESFIQLGWRAEQHQAASDKQGRPVFDNVLVLRHIYPGTTDTADFPVILVRADGERVVVDPARHAKFRDAIEAYEAKSASTLEGTPIAVLTLQPATVAGLAAQNIHSVETLAAVPDSNIERLGPGSRATRERARVYLEAILGGAPAARLSAENEKLQGDLADLKRQVEEMAAERRGQAEDAKTARKASADDVKAARQGG